MLIILKPKIHFLKFCNISTVARHRLHLFHVTGLPIANLAWPNAKDIHQVVFVVLGGRDHRFTWNRLPICITPGHIFKKYMTVNLEGSQSIEKKTLSPRKVTLVHHWRWGLQPRSRWAISLTCFGIKAEHVGWVEFEIYPKVYVCTKCTAQISI